MEHYSKLCEENKLIKMRSAKFIKSEKEISVSRVFKIKEGILFKFTNGSVQMIFVDKVKVIIDFNEKLVLHINPKGGKEFGRMKTSYSITGSNTLLWRFKYIINALKYFGSEKGISLINTPSPLIV